MNIPSDYRQGYETARAMDPEFADRYVAHTVVGDPLADNLIEELSPLDPERKARYVRAAMDELDESWPQDAPPALAEFFEQSRTMPDYFDLDAMLPGVRMFHRNSRIVLAGMMGGVLVEGFMTNISKPFFISGRLRDQGVRRLQQNNRHMIEIFMPNGLDSYGDGWKLSVRIRLVHAQVRKLLNDSDDWDHAAWGMPISAAHLGFSISAFSARLLRHMKSLGAAFDDDERKSFMQVWRGAGHLMGIPDSILYTG